MLLNSDMFLKVKLQQVLLWCCDAYFLWIKIYMKQPARESFSSMQSLSHEKNGEKALIKENLQMPFFSLYKITYLI